MAVVPTEQVSSTKLSPYERWIRTQGIPIHRAFFIEDLRTVEVGWWEFRQCNYLPLAMLVNPFPGYFFNSDYVDLDIVYNEANAFSEAKQVERDDPGERGIRALWVGNFFPDMKTWDKLEAHRRRGAGGSVV